MESLICVSANSLSLAPSLTSLPSPFPSPLPLSSHSPEAEPGRGGGTNRNRSFHVHLQIYSIRSGRVPTGKQQSSVAGHPQMKPTSINKRSLLSQMPCLCVVNPHNSLIRVCQTGLHNWRRIRMLASSHLLYAVG